MENTSVAKIIGYTITLKDFHHVLDLWLNFLLGIAYDKEGCDNHFDNDTWK